MIFFIIIKKDNPNNQQTKPNKLLNIFLHNFFFESTCYIENLKNYCQKIFFFFEIFFCGPIPVPSLPAVQGGTGTLEPCSPGLLDGMVLVGGSVIVSGLWFLMIALHSFRRKIFVALNSIKN